MTYCTTCSDYIDRPEAVTRIDDRPVCLTCMPFHQPITDRAGIQTYIAELVRNGWEHHLEDMQPSPLVARIREFMSTQPDDDAIERFYSTEVLPHDKRSITEILESCDSNGIEWGCTTTGHTAEIPSDEQLELFAERDAECLAVDAEYAFMQLKYRSTDTCPLDDLKDHAAEMLELYRTDDTYCWGTDFNGTNAEPDWEHFYKLFDLHTDGQLDHVIETLEPRTRKATEPEVLQLMLDVATESFQRGLLDRIRRLADRTACLQCLQDNDRNGCYTDAEGAAEGYDPIDMDGIHLHLLDHCFGESLAMIIMVHDACVPGVRNA